ncbi:MAG: replication-associated recombination protein A [Planctomycetes bacterium]|nr:replication-associated recombination protein A [Planctomycetota bacterium]NUQ34061.1 replication-associated recombination protein A [Planctomycetaceae bacterium]
MAELFASPPPERDKRQPSAPAAHTPLAERMRPRALDDIAGQPQVTGANSALRAMLARGELRSMILWGPPGSGKTTLARIVAGAAKVALIELSATGSGVKEVREAIVNARERREQSGAQTVVFIDEIHRFNKSQQDALLHAVEDGTIVLIGATTENPSFEVNSALLSRAQLVMLNALDDGALGELIVRAMADKEYAGTKLAAEAQKLLLTYAQGDARYLLNALEMALLHAKASGQAIIDEAAITAAIGKRALLYDKSGEEHYNLASAMIKSMRVSDADGAIYYAVRMLEGGESPRFVARRMAIFASEDVGNADPQALILAAAAVQVVEFIGLPEAFYTLTQLAAYLALAPKSGAGKQALYAAKDLVAKRGPLPTPMKSRNAPTKMMKELGYGKGYADAHAEADGVLGESYMPEAIANTRLYFPVDRGFERELKKRVDYVLEKRAQRSKEKPSQP